MFISYDGIIFEILKLDNWLREAVYTEDLTTFLYWHHVIEVTCVLNDDATNAENFPILVRKNPIDAAVGPSLKSAGGGSRWEGQIGVDKPVADNDPNNLERAAFGLPTIDPRTLIDVSSKSVGGGSIGSPGEGKGFSVTESKTDVMGGKETTSALDIGFAKGGPGPLASDLLRKPKKGNAKRNAVVRRPFIGKDRTPFDRSSHTIPTTDRELRGRLSLPRRKLAIWMLTGQNGTRDYSLISPQGTCETDCKSGPLCTIMDNVDTIGQMTSVMKLKFETWEGPPIQFQSESGTSSLKSKASGNTNSKDVGAVLKGGTGAGIVGRINNIIANAPAAGVDGKGANAAKAGPTTNVITPAILSHRWEMSFGWNPETYLKTRRIKGEVLFRSDVLSLRNLSADQLRPYFMCHTIPLGYKRIPDNGDMVKENSEGTGITYYLQDEQQMMNFPGGVTWGLIKMEATSEYAYHSIDFDLQERSRTNQ